MDQGNPFAPARITVRATTPAQFLWVSLGATCGAIEPPFPVEGFYRCSYDVCGRLFFSEQARTKGENVFCSPRCGKSFWATKRMREKRAEERAKKS